MDNMFVYNSKYHEVMSDMYSHYTNATIESFESIPRISDKDSHFVPSFYFNNEKKIRAGNLDREIGEWNDHVIIKTDAIVYYDPIRSALSSYKHGIIDGVPVDKLIEQEVIQPFFLFRNGLFMRWSSILLYKDLYATHLYLTEGGNGFSLNDKPGFIIYEIDNEEDDIHNRVPSHDISIVNFPISKNLLFYTERGEHIDPPVIPGQDTTGPEDNPWTLIFAFNEKGYYKIYGKTRIYMNNRESNIGYVQLRIPGAPGNIVESGNPGITASLPIIEDDVQIPDECLLYESNVLVMNNKVRFSYRNEYIIKLSPYNTLTILSKETGKPVYGIEYKVFYDKMSQKPYNNVSQIPNHDFLRHTYLNEDPHPEWMETLHRMFDFDLNPDKTFDENMVDFYAYLKSYNYRVLIDKIRSNRVVIYGDYVGHMDKSTRSRRLLMFPKEWDSSTIGYMLFVNGLLSNDYVLEETTYGVYVDFSKYSDNSYYEMIIMNNKASNMTYTITNPEQTLYFPVKDNDCIYEYYCSENSNQIFDILDQMKDHVRYKIPKEDYKEDETGVTILNDFYLQNKTIYRVPTDRVVQAHIIVDSDEFFEWHLDPEKFKFCDDKNRYLVFVNGLRLSSALYRIIVPDPLTPFDDQAIYFNIWLNRGDSVYVYYTCLDTIDEVHIDRTSGSDLNKSGIDTLGYIVGPVDYPVPLSKYLQFYFINGIKVPEEYLMDISYNTIRLTVNMKTIENLTIVGIDSELIEFFEQLKLPKSYLDEVFQSNDKNTINIMTNTYTSITDSQVSRKKDIDDHAMINEIVRHYYGHVNKGVPFRYVYDDNVYAEVDKDGNIIIDIMDATRVVNLLPDEDDPIRKEQADDSNE